MLIVLYVMVWILLAAAAGILLVTGFHNEITMTLFGFLASALGFTGIIGILPWWMEKHYSRHSVKY